MAQPSVQPSDAPWPPAGRLSAFYPNAAYDFYGTPSSPLCVYKSGDPWPVRTGLEAQRIIREARLVRHDHPQIQALWPAIGEPLYKLLDSKNIRWTSIDPVAFADARNPKPFCPLLFWIGVEPLGMITGGAVGRFKDEEDADDTANVDVTHATPFWFILEQIQKVSMFSNSHLYQAGTTAPSS
ncbi:hypothetical protein F5880DRAFT_1578098 [Lentinula raphanica]|nr:hypothetical protein F5880DRAFT_1578098 [Lentinula raphanica]